MLKIPYIALAITHICNYSCSYCNPLGESFGTSPNEIPLQEWLKIIESAYEVGFRTFRITGGEPLLRKDIKELLRFIDKFNDVKINLCTNGELLLQFCKFLASLKNLNGIRISLDTINPFSGFPKYLTKSKLKAIKYLKRRGIYLRINTVVTKKNEKEVLKLLLFCITYKIDLKLLDLYWDFPQNKKYWEENFVNLRKFAYLLQTMGGKLSPVYNVDVGFGIPMYSYKIGGIQVIFKDSFRGTYYHPFCKNCANYPCQEGFYTPFISSDGTLHPSHCTNSKFAKTLPFKSKKEIRENLNWLLGEFKKISYSHKLPQFLREKLW
jgi:molybdenum cofactor biosynthesis enzyme MoaA